MSPSHTRRFGSGSVLITPALLLVSPPRSACLPALSSLPVGSSPNSATPWVTAAGLEVNQACISEEIVELKKFRRAARLVRKARRPPAERAPRPKRARAALADAPAEAHTVAEAGAATQKGCSTVGAEEAAATAKGVKEWRAVLGCFVTGLQGRCKPWQTHFTRVLIFGAPG